MDIWRCTGEEVITEEDLPFFCECGTDMEWTDDGEIVCPRCGRRVGRREYFEATGVTPPNDGCEICAGHYPSCKCDCPMI